MIVGIDLGTTYSLVAWLSPDGPALIPNALGEFLTPSVVGIDLDDQMLCGKSARELAVTHPDRAAALFKRLMGTDTITQIAEKSYNAEELSSIVLRTLKSDAESFLKNNVTEAVITVPAYFSDDQRKATIRAGEMAGLKVRRIINEPTAAAIAYGLHDKDRERIALIYDLGGGTFDVSIVDQFDGTLEIRASAGEVFLGGEDFTRAMANLILKERGQFYEQMEIRHPLYITRLLRECEIAKRALSSEETATVRIPTETGVVDDTAETVTVTRDSLNQATQALLSRTLGPLRRVLSDSNIERQQIDEVILVGGATRMAQITPFLQEHLQQPVLCSLDPDHVVALGAAVQSGLVTLDRSVDDIVVTDVAPFTLGVEMSRHMAGQVRDGYFAPLINRNTTIPISRVETFSTIQPNQTQVKLKVYQGEARRTADNLLLGEFEVNGIPAGPAGQEIEVRFTYDLNGVLEVEATITATGDTATFVVTRHARDLSEMQLTQAVDKMQALKLHPREDTENRYLLRRADRLYRELANEHRQMLEQLISGFEEALELQDPAAIETHRLSLTSFVEAFDQSDL